MVERREDAEEDADMMILMTLTQTQILVAQKATLQEEVTTEIGKLNARKWDAHCGTENLMEIALTELILRQENATSNVSSDATWELEHAIMTLTANHHAL